MILANKIPCRMKLQQNSKDRAPALDLHAHHVVVQCWREGGC